MRVTVEYFGPARDAAGVGREVVEFDPPCTAPDLIARIAAERGGRLANLLVAGGQLSRSLVLAVNDRQSTTTDATPLQDGDEIAVIPPVSGGSRG